MHVGDLVKFNYLAPHKPGIGIDRGRDHGQKLGHQRLTSPHKMLHGLAHAMGLLRIVEHRRSVLVLEGEMDMTALPGIVQRPPRHEGSH